MSGNFEIIVNSTSINITSYMTYGYDHRIDDNKVTHRTRNGAEFIYTFGSPFDRFQIPLTGVSCGNATTINSWWMDNSVVNYTENSSVTPVLSGFKCRIINNDQPLDTYVDANFGVGLFNGTIILETI